MFLIIKVLRSRLCGFLLFTVIIGGFVGYHQFKLHRDEQDRQQTKLRRKQQRIIVFTKQKLAYEDKIPDWEKRKIVAVIEAGEEVKIIRGLGGSLGVPLALRCQLKNGQTALLYDIEDIDNSE